jgi:predicted metal-dependent peptidase
MNKNYDQKKLFSRLAELKKECTDDQIESIVKEIIKKINISLLSDLDYMFYGIFSCNTKFICNKYIDTLCVSMSLDGPILSYNPYFLAAAFDIGLGPILFIHEFEHLIRCHLLRQAELGFNDFVLACPSDGIIRKISLYNIAADLKINYDIGLSLQQPFADGINLDTYSITEVIYADLLKKIDKDSINPDCIMCIGDLDGKDIDNSHEHIYKDILASIIEQCKMAGSTPGHLNQYITELKKSEVHWSVLLKRVIGFYYGKRRTSYSRSNRIIRHMNFIFPGYSENNSGTIVVALDVSGSIPSQDYQQFLSELDAASDHGIKIFVVVFDYDVDKEKYPMKYKKGMFKHLGYSGGGTSYLNLFTFLRERKLWGLPLFVLTDGYCDFPNIDKQDLYWIMTTDTIPPYGKIVRIGRDKNNPMYSTTI